MIDLRCCSATDLLAGVAPGTVTGVIADPPWAYQNGTNQGGAGKGSLFDLTRPDAGS